LFFPSLCSGLIVCLAYNTAAIASGVADKELARQHQADIRYLHWLRQLAEFLRHEVRQPVAQINSSIELIQLQTSDADALQPYIASASLGAQHV
jgi:uncharacterized membrane protein YebE (DUF533 family)